MSSSKSAALALYARVLRAHRVLPREMRQLGDAYVKDEFRKHRAAAPSFLPSFFAEWTSYAHALDGKVAPDSATNTHVGAPMPDLLAALSPQQLQSMVNMREEVEGEAAAPRS